MASFEEIDEARKIFGLGEAATSKEIRNAYRRLARHHHPDRCNGDAQGEEVMKKLNRAYKLLEDYCRNYKYGFRREDVRRTYPDEEYIRKWRDNWFDSI